nr:hypothetical protein [uncultured Cellulosilyticum sp.]
MIKVLLKNDLKYMKKDPMMIVTLLLPFILIGVYKGIVRGLPIVFGEGIGTYINLYMKLLQYVMITMGSSMPGVVMSLRILDDKDEHMLAFYAVSPLKLSGYFLYRSIGSAVLSMGAAIIACLGIMGNIPGIYVLYVTILGLLLTLAIGGLAKNKLQGMVCMKLTGVVVILPCVRLLGENQMNWVLKYQPWDYAYQLIMKESINIGNCMLYVVIALGLCLMLLGKVKY